MAKRLTISKKIRFEVFKRDQFKCQYCGKSAPEVTLHVDHIVPVSKGGGNEILNLVSACADCNLGKSDRRLSDDSAAIKQKKQADHLQEIRQQKEMMANWLNELSKGSDFETDTLTKYIDETYKVYLNDYGRDCLKKTIKKYGFQEVTIAIDISAQNYLKDRDIKEQRANFINKIERICFYREADRKDPIGAEIRNITNLANKLWWNCDWRSVAGELRNYYEKGWTLEEIRQNVFKTKGITAFHNAMEASNV